MNTATKTIVAALDTVLSDEWGFEPFDANQAAYDEECRVATDYLWSAEFCGPHYVPPASAFTEAAVPF